MRHLRDVLISWGPVGMLLIALLDNAGPPSPGATDIVLLVLAAAPGSRLLLLAGMACLGSLTGSAIFFEVFHRGGERLLLKHTSGPRGARFRRWTKRYGLMPVFVSALVPVPLPILPFKVFVASAAAMGVSRTRFMLVLVSARAPRYLALAYLGKTLGEHSGEWIKSHTWTLLGLAVAVGVVIYMVIRWIDRDRHWAGELQ